MAGAATHTQQQQQQQQRVHDLPALHKISAGRCGAAVQARLRVLAMPAIFLRVFLRV